MNLMLESLAQLFGRKPRKPTKEMLSPDVQKVHFHKRKDKVTKAMLEEAHRNHSSHKWLIRRWLTLVLVNILFVISYQLDIQILEGSLTASRFVGFHMADLNASLQVMLAFKHVVLNLIIGTVTVFLMWWLLGGRTFCSWVCPYHLVSELAERLHLWLAKRRWAKNITFHRGVRTVLYIIFVALAVFTGYTVFETISPTGILSRALIYGPGVALVWVFALILFEVFFSRRAWCRYICPIGMTYGFVGAISPLRVKYTVKDCHHEGDCRKVCLVPHVLDITIKGRATDVSVPVGADCTRCGLCVDICPTDSLKFEVKGLDKLL